MVKDAIRNPANLFALYTALLGGNYVVYHMVLPVRISYHLLMTGLLIWWIWRDGLPSTPLLWPLLGLGAVTGVSAFNSLDSRIALEAWWHWIVNGLLMLMLINWIRRGWGETLFKTHFAIGGVIIAASLVQWAISPGQRVGGAFMLINLTGAYAAALLVPAFVWAWCEKRLWIFAIGFGLGLVLLMNESRGAFVSVGMAAIVFILLRYRVKLETLLISAVIVFVLARGVMGLNALSSGHAAGDVLRLDLWRSALAMVTDRPLTGVGPGLFGQSYRAYRSGTDDNMTGAHSIYLNILAELGVTGGAASAVAVLFFLRSIPRKRSAKDDAVLAALVGIATHLAFDNFPATNFVFLVSLYVAYLSGHQKQLRSSSDLKLAAARALTGVLVLFGFSFVLMDAAQFYYEESLSNHSVSEAMAAASLDPNNRLYQIHLARLQGDKARVLELDPTFYEASDLGAYSVINFGRFLY